MPPSNPTTGFRPTQFNFFRSDRSNGVHTAAALGVAQPHQFGRRFSPYSNNTRWNAVPSNDNNNNMAARTYRAEQRLADVSSLSQNPTL
jgi:hypothetical protein